jgi:glycosyltransferase involved in cell wall biosynthesis
MGRVDVLMSTFNGERYLEQQLRSILTQDHSDLRIIVRDDNSTDGTRAILTRASAKDRRLLVEYGERHIGAVASFMNLLSRVSKRTGFVAFADQDDVWDRDKITRAVSVLANLGTDEPGLYCSRMIVTNEFLQPIGRSPPWLRRPSFSNALVENIANGCTIALNQPAISLFRGFRPPVCATAHDWWCYLTVSAFGTVVYDPQPSMRYRLHGHNAIGIQLSPIAKIFGRVRRQLRRDFVRIILDQAQEFRERYGSCLHSNLSEILDILLKPKSFKEVIKFAQSDIISRQSKIDQLCLKILIITSHCFRQDGISRSNERLDLPCPAKSLNTRLGLNDAIRYRLDEQSARRT